MVVRFRFEWLTVVIKLDIAASLHDGGLGEHSEHAATSTA